MIKAIHDMFPSNISNHGQMTISTYKMRLFGVSTYRVTPSAREEQISHREYFSEREASVVCLTGK